MFKAVDKTIILLTTLACCLCFATSQIHSKTSPDGSKPQPIKSIKADHDISADNSGLTLSDDRSTKGNLKTVTTPSMGDSNCDLFYIIASTIDGKVSALDLHKQGKLVWSMEADSRPLLSSSLANIKMVKNGKRMRLIPSLDGALYQYDGEKVEAIPMSAETLLSSTYRLSDDSMIVGSKDIKSFGVDIASGKMLFHCGSDGCHHEKSAAEQDLVDRSSILVVTRNTQVVRSVDMQTGFEKWNFSVGQHEVRLPSNTGGSHIDDESVDDMDDDPYDDWDETYNFSSFKECPHEEKYASDSDYENFLRLVVPEGRVVALNREDLSLVNWEYQFDSPIAKAWLYRNGKLELFSLFDRHHVPTISAANNNEEDDDGNESMPRPSLYIGSHQKLMYIQPSPQMEAVLKKFPATRIGHVIDPDIKVSWRPYLNTASVRTPTFSGNWPEKSQLDRGDSETEDSRTTTSLTLWHEEYPFDTGFFLFPEFRDSRIVKRGSVMLIENMQESSSSEPAEDMMAPLPASLWMYWREILVIVIITIAVHTIMVKYFNFNIIGNSRSNDALLTNSSGMRQDSQESLSNSNEALPRSGSFEGPEYVSRFATDFDCLHCLGKGGFGVVFEAVNKMDDQHYAIKRIVLPKSDGAKEKVLREVKVLAKLEHSGIVRFFNAWVESPPPGWQEERDKSYRFSDLSGTNFSPTASISATPQHPKPGSPHQKRAEQCTPTESQLLAVEDGRHQQLKPGAAEEASLNSDSDSVVFARDDDNMIPAGGSGEFSVHSYLCDSASDSWSAQPAETKNLATFGLDCDFGESTGTRSGSRSSVPFSNYSSNSSSALSHRPDGTDNDRTGDSVIFESSSCNQSTGTESVIFASSRHGPVTSSVDNEGQNARLRSTDHAIDISLSSCGDDDGDKDKDVSATNSRLFLYIQMQLYRKDTLKDWLANNTLNRDRQFILTIFDEIVCAVDYVHKQGLIHRDLKPSNIFFSADGHIKVGDFGLVTAQSAQHDQQAQASSPLSEKHTAEVGTTLYMSPEQMSNKPYDLKVDIFSLGLIFLEFWVPFATQMERLKTLHAAKRQLLPDVFKRELPVESGLVSQMICENPQTRPETGEILDHLLFQDVASHRIDQRTRKRTMSELSG